MYLKIHSSYRGVVAVCDSDLVGKTLEEGIFQLKIKENFFKGEEIDKEKAIEIFQDFKKEDATFYIVGEESTKTALKAGIISKDGIGTIQNVPFALVLL